ncbi:MAG: ParA family protein [Nocardioides sp.]
MCVASGKGGVSKTSLTANLAGLAAAAGHRTLIVDLDPQGDISDDLGYFDDPRADDGQHLATSMVTGQPLRALMAEVRANLDVIPGGEHLSDVKGMLLARQARAASTVDLLAKSLSPLAQGYDLVLIDTPPTDDSLQLLALTAARWLLIPTKADTSSIRAIQRIAMRTAETRAQGHIIDILGVVLVGVPTAASRVRSAAERDIQQLLGNVAPLFEGGIRDSAAVARETRAKGVLTHELAEEVEGAEPFWKSLRDGVPPTRLPGSAPALADDYVRIAEQVLRRIDQLEQAGAA